MVWAGMPLALLSWQALTYAPDAPTMRQSDQPVQITVSLPIPKRFFGSLRLVFELLLSPIAVFIAIALIIRFYVASPIKLNDPAGDGLVMRGGDPYLRALMRTIATERERPYSLLPGGGRIDDFSRHPDRCWPKASADCTTAAGRYRFLATTWLRQAAKYHPRPDGIWPVQRYPFTPEAQDVVTYRWLSDAQAWHGDLKVLLRQGQIYAVFDRVSPVWTSLRSSEFAARYDALLSDELAQYRPVPQAQARSRFDNPIVPLRHWGQDLGQRTGQTIDRLLPKPAPKPAPKPVPTFSPTATPKPAPMPIEREPEPVAPVQTPPTPEATPTPGTAPEPSGGPIDPGVSFPIE
jgi:muramidase (phage lysozyme)